MQIIVVSRHLKSARTITIMPRHVLGALAVFFVLVFLSSAFFSFISLHFRLPIVENILLSVQQQETRQTRDYITNNLNLMATRLGELQGRLLQLDTLGDRVSDLAGIKPKAADVAEKPGQGGPFLPAPLSATELQQEIERLATAVDRQADDLAFMEFKLLEKRVEERLMPTTLPVKNAVFGSGFGYRNDPFAGLRSRHDGLDFAAPTGTPVVAAADGVVLTASYHQEFGNMIDVDHGDGLVSRYAHLSAMDVVESQIVRRGDKIGAVGTTGRSTGPHLHFEVRMLGVPQNPATFLKRGEDFARLQRR
ncbi:M23 family metallopeptidase [uncultured Azonexus sp.]|uniref:M23 family metallopeptidase n=1 Tax=uncultured Azonexus sp. TaxID=520307 RepID=UPI00260C6692|nr:M23 family metallopeptidase [uncultured Azonexus sp.]